VYFHPIIPNQIPFPVVHPGMSYPFSSNPQTTTKEAESREKFKKKKGKNKHPSRAREPKSQNQIGISSFLTLRTNAIVYGVLRVGRPNAFFSRDTTEQGSEKQRKSETSTWRKAKKQSGIWVLRARVYIQPVYKHIDSRKSGKRCHLRTRWTNWARVS
jgi:hypothetical protein